MYLSSAVYYTGIMKKRQAKARWNEGNEGMKMDAVKRIQMIRMLGKIEKDPKFSEKLGIKNKSVFKTAGQKGGMR